MFSSRREAIAWSALGFCLVLALIGALGVLAALSPELPGRLDPLASIGSFFVALASLVLAGISLRIAAAAQASGSRGHATPDANIPAPPRPAADEDVPVPLTSWRPRYETSALSEPYRPWDFMASSDATESPTLVDLASHRTRRATPGRRRQLVDGDNDDQYWAQLRGEAR